MFTAFLKYKLEEQGKRTCKSKHFFANSQICNICGYKNSETKTLPSECGIARGTESILTEMLNAVINIRNEGMRLVTA